MRKDAPLRYIQNRRAFRTFASSFSCNTTKCFPLPRGISDTIFLNSSKSSCRDLYFFDNRLKSFENSLVSLKFIVIISYRVILVSVEDAFVADRLSRLMHAPGHIAV